MNERQNFLYKPVPWAESDTQVKQHLQISLVLL